MLACPASADDLWLSVTVGSYHFDRSASLCEFNPGAGIEYAFAPKVRAIAGFYKDSLCDQRVYAGLSFALAQAGPVRFAAVAGIISNRAEDAPAPIMPLLAPFLQIEGKDLGANIFLAPRVNDNPGFIGLQLTGRAMTL